MAGSNGRRHGHGLTLRVGFGKEASPDTRQEALRSEVTAGSKKSKLLLSIRRWRSLLAPGTFFSLSCARIPQGSGNAAGGNDHMSFGGSVPSLTILGQGGTVVALEHCKKKLASQLSLRTLRCCSTTWLLSDWLVSQGRPSVGKLKRIIG